jgi:hypothetical protein
MALFFHLPSSSCRPPTTECLFYLGGQHDDEEEEGRTPSTGSQFHKRRKDKNCDPDDGREVVCPWPLTG